MHLREKGLQPPWRHHLEAPSVDERSRDANAAETTPMKVRSVGIIQSTSESLPQNDLSVLFRATAVDENWERLIAQGAALHLWNARVFD